MTIEELRSLVEALQAEILELAEIEDATEDQEVRFDAALIEFAEAKDNLGKAEAREAQVAEVRRTEIRQAIDNGTARVGGPDVTSETMETFSVNVRTDPFDFGDVRSLNGAELRDRSMRVIEDDRYLPADQAEKLERLMRGRSENLDGREVSRRLLSTENPAYRSAFQKAIFGRQDELSDNERRALSEVRAQTSADAAGGYGVPVLIDPTIILTSGAADAPVVALARVENITTKEWKGVSSAAVSWSNDGADAGTTPIEVSDDAVTLAQPTVVTYEQRGFIPYTLAIAEDYPGFATEMRLLLEQGYVDHLAVLSATGSGTGPQGIITALDGNTFSEVVVGTDGAFSVPDVRKVWKELPEKYRSRATWVMHTDVDNEIESFGSAVGSDYTVDLASPNARQIKGRPVALTDYFPEFSGITTAANILVVGDFTNYLVAQRIGMTIENVGHLFSTTSNRPISRKGWLARSRVGMDSVNDNGFRLLQNQ